MLFLSWNWLAIGIKWKFENKTQEIDLNVHNLMYFMGFIIAVHHFNSKIIHFLHKMFIFQRK